MPLTWSMPPAVAMKPAGNWTPRYMVVLGLLLYCRISSISD